VHRRIVLVVFAVLQFVAVGEEAVAAALLVAGEAEKLVEGLAVHVVGGGGGEGGADERGEGEVESVGGLHRAAPPPTLGLGLGLADGLCCVCDLMRRRRRMRGETAGPALPLYTSNRGGGSLPQSLLGGVPPFYSTRRISLRGHFGILLFTNKFIFALLFPLFPLPKTCYMYFFRA